MLPGSLTDSSNSRSGNKLIFGGTLLTNGLKWTPIIIILLTCTELDAFSYRLLGVTSSDSQDWFLFSFVQMHSLEYVKWLRFVVHVYQVDVLFYPRNIIFHHNLVKW